MDAGVLPAQGGLNDTSLFATALAVTLAQPAAAVTFPTLTTIYVGAGVVTAIQSVTVVHCSNVSGVVANLRFLILDKDGSARDSHTVANLARGRTYSVATFAINTFVEDFVFPNTVDVTEGVLNVESTQSGVFCNAKIVDVETAAGDPGGFPLSLVRVNPHSGTVE